MATLRFDYSNIKAIIPIFKSSIFIIIIFLNIVFIFSQPILRIVTLKNDAQRSGLSAVLVIEKRPDCNRSRFEIQELKLCNES